MTNNADRARDKRDVARRARRLAAAQSSDADRARLHQFADELDQEAAHLEQTAEGPALGSLPGTITQQQQQQQQQQQAKEPPTAPDERKDGH